MPFDFNYKGIKLIILDFLDETDLQSGGKLYEDLRYKSYIDETFSVTFLKIPDLKTLDSAINWIIEEIKKREFFPIIHFEAHGSDYGLKFSKNDRIEWSILLSKLREINILLINNLILTMSACKGATLIYKIDYYKRAPFRLVIGPEYNITAGELYNGFFDFYDNLFFNFDFNKAHDSLYKNIFSFKDNFSMIRSDTCFDIYTDFNEKSKNFEDVIEPYRQHSLKTFPNFQYMPIELQRKEAMRGLKVVLEKLKKEKNYFTMNDL